MSASRCGSAFVRLVIATAAALTLASASASATVLTSQITTPADLTFLPTAEAPFFGPLAQALEVSGTVTTDDANASDKVELGCYYVSSIGVPSVIGLQNFEGLGFELKVHPDGTFSTAELSGEQRVSLERLSDGEQPCTLRAVPPGTPPSAALSPFKGARVGVSEYTRQELVEGSGRIYDFYDTATTFEGYWGWDSVGSCGPYSRMFDPVSFREQNPDYTSDCEGNLYLRNESETAPSIVVDGHNAYAVESQRFIHLEGEGETFVSDEHHTLNPLDGTMTQTWTEVLTRCESAGGVAVDELNPEAAKCVKFVPTGVMLVRTVTTGESGLQATVTDHFESTDGASHAIDLSYGEEDNGNEENPSYRFPGDAGFSVRAKGATAAMGAAPATVYFEADPSALEPADGLQNPLGAITLSAAPAGVVFANNRVFELLYPKQTVPASGALTFTEVLSQALTLARVQQLAQLGEDRLAGPSVSISAPATGSVVSTPSVTVSGSAADNFGVASLNVGGAAVPYAGSGPWSSTVALNPGANTITASATDHAGNVAATSVTVTYAPPALPPALTLAKLSRVGATSGANGKVMVTLACSGPAGSSCVAQATLTSVEKLRHGKLTGIAARVRSKTVTVGSARVTIAAGKRKTVTIVLNATGRRLLAHFHRLPAHLVVVLIGNGGKKTTATAQTVTITPRSQAQAQAQALRRRRPIEPAQAGRPTLAAASIAPVTSARSSAPVT